MGLTGAQRASRHRARKRATGVAAVTLPVPAAARTDLRMLAEALCADPELRPAPLRDPRNGRLVSAKRVLSHRAAPR